MSLEAWAASKGSKMIVVSNDNDWKNYCRNSEALICHSDLTSILGKFNEKDEFVAERVVNAISKGSDPELDADIDRKLENYIEGLSPDVDASSGYHYDLEFEGAAYISHSEPQPDYIAVLSSDEESVTFYFKLEVQITAQASFTFLYKDEGEYFPIGSASSEIETEIEVTMTATVMRAFEDGGDVSDLEVEDQRWLHLDFGHIEPDYGEEPDWD